MNRAGQNDEKLDALLESALSRYGDVEPLSGLEARILERLRRQPARRGWLMWGALAATALVVAGIALYPLAERPGPKVVTVPSKSVSPVATAAASGTKTAPPQRVTASAPRRERRTQTASAKAKLPRREVFPSPSPPSEQELLLAEYMASVPRTELLAQASRQPLPLHEDPSQPAVGTNKSPDPRKLDSIQ